jgi:hypothetical protein
LPGIGYFRLTQSLADGDSILQGTSYEDKAAFVEPIQAFYKAVVEFEDHGGNLYRQYGDVEQVPQVNGAFFDYKLSELSKPYLVSSRIASG